MTTLFVPAMESAFAMRVCAEKLVIIQKSIMEDFAKIAQ